MHDDNEKGPRARISEINAAKVNGCFPVAVSLMLNYVALFDPPLNAIGPTELFVDHSRTIHIPTNTTSSLAAKCCAQLSTGHAAVARLSRGTQCRQIVVREIHSTRKITKFQATNEQEQAGPVMLFASKRSRQAAFTS